MAPIDPDETAAMIAICDRLIDLYVFQEAVTGSPDEAECCLQNEIDDLLKKAALIRTRESKGSA